MWRPPPLPDANTAAAPNNLAYCLPACLQHALQTYVLKLARSGEDGDKALLLVESGVRFHTVEVRAAGLRQGRGRRRQRQLQQALGSTPSSECCSFFNHMHHNSVFCMCRQCRRRRTRLPTSPSSCASISGPWGVAGGRVGKAGGVDGSVWGLGWKS